VRREGRGQDVNKNQGVEPAHMINYKRRRLLNILVIILIPFPQIISVIKVLVLHISIHP
jgi:hypothetical protein